MKKQKISLGKKLLSVLIVMIMIISLQNESFVKAAIDVSNIVAFSDMKLESSMTYQSDPTYVYVTDAEYTKFSANYYVPDSVNSGDTFTINWGSVVGPYGEQYLPTVPALKAADGQTIANGTYDPITNTTKYVFTSYVDIYNNVAGKFTLICNPLIDRSFTDLKVETVTVSIGSKSVTSNIKYNWGNSRSSMVTTGVDYIDSVTKEYHFTSYVNQSGLTGYYSMNPTFRLSTSGYYFDGTNDYIKVYEVPSTAFVDSFNPDYSKLGTPVYSVIPSYGTTLLDVNLDSFSTVYDNNNIYYGKRYIVEYKLTLNTGTVTPYVNTAFYYRATATDGYTYWYNNSSETIYSSNIYTGSTGSSSTTGAYSIGDYTWLDSNKNGIQDTGEAPLAGVTVNLYDSAGDKIRTVTTDDSGKYLFTGLPASVYRVEFVAPAGYTITKTSGTTDTSLDSNPLSSQVNLTASNTTVDAGFYATMPMPTLTKSVSKSDGSLGRSTTDPLFIARGETFTYSVDMTLPANISGYESLSLSDTLNQPLQIGNAKVLVNGTSDSVLTSQTISNTSNNTLSLVFSRTQISEYAGKKITLSFDATLPIDGNLTSYANETIPNTATMSVNGSTYSSNKVNVRPYLSIGDYTFVDFNKNGIQDSGDSPFPNVKVNLYDANNVLLKTTLTDSDGKYLFDNLAAGTYKVVFETPSGYTLTKTSGTTDTSLDSNPLSNTVILNANDMTIDAGFYSPPPTISKSVSRFDGSSLTTGTTALVVDAGEKYNYNIDLNIPAIVAGYTSITISDTLETPLSLVGVKVLVDGVEDSNLSYHAIINGQTASLPLTQSQIEDYKGKKITLVITSSLKSGADLTAYTNKTIPNKATMTFNGISSTSNTVNVTPTIGVVNVKKVDKATRAALPDATFNLLDSNKQVVATGTTDALGNLTFNNIPSGTYTLKETKAPSGYFINNTGWVVNVSSKTPTVTVTAENTKNNLVTNSGYGLAFINKLDQNLNALPGASFGLFSGDYTHLTPSSTPIATAVSDSNGLVYFNNLAPGVYTIKEISAPSGYMPTTTTWTVNVASTGATSVLANPSKIENTTYTPKDVGSLLTISNYKFEVYGNPGVTTVYPNRANYLDMSFSGQVNSGAQINPGDYFDVVLDSDLNPWGLESEYQPNPLYINGIMIASDTLIPNKDANGNITGYTIRYTFTDAIKYFDPSTVSFSIQKILTIDEYDITGVKYPNSRYYISNGSAYENINITNKVAGIVENSGTYKVDYSTNSSNEWYATANTLTGALSISTIDYSMNTMTTYYYVNIEKNSSTSNVNVEITPKTGNTNMDVSSSSITIFQVPSTSVLKPSFGFKESSYTNVTNSFTITRSTTKDTITVGFTPAKYNGTSYIIKIVTPFHSDDDAKAIWVYQRDAYYQLYKGVGVQSATPSNNTTGSILPNSADAVNFKLPDPMYFDISKVRPISGGYRDITNGNLTLKITPASGQTMPADFNGNLILDLSKQPLRVTVPLNWPTGTYTVTEAIAPAGYIKTNSVYQITIDQENRTIIWNSRDGTPINKVLYADTVGTTIEKLQIINQAKTLPSTGGIGSIIFKITGLLMMLLAVLSEKLRKKCLVKTQSVFKNKKIYSQGEKKR